MNSYPLLAIPFTVTFIFPVVAPSGTGIVIAVALQELGIADVPFTVIVLDPCEEPKLTPKIVTSVFVGAELAESPLINGFELTVYGCVLLPTPLTVTFTFTEPLMPDGAVTTIELLLQLVTWACCVPNVTLLDPCTEPKFAPDNVTAAPTGPVDGDME